MKTSENFLEGMAEEHEPVDSPAYQWFVRFKYMPILAQLEEKDVCWYDHELAFGESEMLGIHRTQIDLDYRCKNHLSTRAAIIM